MGCEPVAQLLHKAICALDGGGGVTGGGVGGGSRAEVTCGKYKLHRNLLKAASQFPPLLRKDMASSARRASVSPDGNAHTSPCDGEEVWVWGCGLKAKPLLGAVRGKCTCTGQKELMGWEQLLMHQPAEASGRGSRVSRSRSTSGGR
jgi:hypothetical protein